MKNIINKSLAAVYIYTCNFNKIKNKTNKKENKSYASNKIKTAGITLIALVITIIILLILAGVTVETLKNTGLFSKTKLAKEKYSNSEQEEKKKLNEYEKEISKADEETEEDDDKPKIKYEIIAIGTSNDTNNNESVEDCSQENNTILYINIKATLEGKVCTVTFKNDNSKTVPYSVTKNGYYTFTVTGKYNNQTISEDKVIKVKKFKGTTTGMVKYDAGTWTQEEIDELNSQNLYMYNSTYSANSTFRITNPQNNNALNFTFGGFTAGKSKNDSVPCYYWSTFMTPKNSGWQILTSGDMDTDGNGSNDRTYVKSIVHAGAPENFVYYYTTSNDAFRAEYLLSGGKEQKNYNKLSTGEIISSRNWSEYYIDKNLKSIIKEVHAMTYNDAYEITNSLGNTTDERRKTNAFYWVVGDEQGCWLKATNQNGEINYWDGYYGYNVNCLGIRPVVTMVDGVYISGGSGTKDDPYILSKE